MFGCHQHRVWAWALTLRRLQLRFGCIVYPATSLLFFFSPSRSILNYFPNFLRNGRLCPLPFVKLWGPSGVCCWQRKTACGICCKYFMFGQNHASVCVCVCGVPPRQGSFEATPGKPPLTKLLLELAQAFIVPKDFMGTSAGSGCPRAARNGGEKPKSGPGELRDCAHLPWLSLHPKPCSTISLR